jgi:L-arabinose isomerase
MESFSMKTSVENIRIGILPGMADLYNRLSPGLRDRLTQFFKGEIENLKTDGLEFILNDVVCTVEQVDAGCSRLIELDVDLIVPALAPYCPSGVLAPAFLQLDTPILLWPAQGIFELKPDLYDSSAVIMNHGVHGVQDLANVLRRKGKFFGVIHGHWRQDSFRRELFSWAQAARAIQSMRKSNPVQIGGHFKDMLDLQIGSDEFIEKLGVTHKAVSLNDFVDVLKKIEDGRLEKRIASYRTLFEINSGINDALL